MGGGATRKHGGKEHDAKVRRRPAGSSARLARGGGPRRVGTIENAEQLGLLKSLGCELGQGYHFGKLLPSGQATGLLASSLLPTA